MVIDQIRCVELGKRYNREWIFKGVDTEFLKGTACAVLGRNGSGKSSFIQVLSGNMMQSEGQVIYECKGKVIEQEQVYKNISYSAPYLELIEEFSLAEAVRFQSRFKGFMDNMSEEEVIEKSGLKKESGKMLKYFSSGMKQRVKLTLSILANTSLVFLDEPASNLDKAGIDWYRGLIEAYRRDRFVFVCSNQQAHEFDFCETVLKIEDYKKR